MSSRNNLIAKVALSALATSGAGTICNKILTRVLDKSMTVIEIAGATVAVVGVVGAGTIWGLTDFLFPGVDMAERTINVIKAKEEAENESAK